MSGVRTTINAHGELQSMTVRELKILLEQTPDDYQVVVDMRWEDDEVIPVEQIDDESFSFNEKKGTLTPRKSQTANPCVVLYPR